MLQNTSYNIRTTNQYNIITKQNLKTNWMWNMATMRIELEPKFVMVIRHFLHHVAFVHIIWV